MRAKPFRHAEEFWCTDMVVGLLLRDRQIRREQYPQSWERRFMQRCWIEHHGRKPDTITIEKRITRDARFLRITGFPPDYVRRMVVTIPERHTCIVSLATSLS
ncbi:hypothetical protein A3A38_01200 [Candidatus Kaiserbacteria bacterium RIFCSPLOWO2_01_FULL_53_17]|uniref:Uncharacterized protein n=1 Tax=Candidatus Kaiserbacteria bacterium RIFCSPLOWO2_01_FULL_53_17 TaxID=1798511 RepID=A0A1F6EH93_9BACT|nr:MAG: hypothetical protein A3A38_01200 [Candidatus Kaiserbacteria bacterium RIFCSPLOWO2_01_FULL_53_17]